MQYELFIGLRYLKAKRKQAFISVITFISILGITVGVTALIIVLSVMAGFEETLREKILGINAHVVVMGFGAGISDYQRVADEIKSVDGVTGVTPFTYSQAMLSSDGGATGAVLRGLDLKTAEGTSPCCRKDQGRLAPRHKRPAGRRDRTSFRPRRRERDGKHLGLAVGDRVSVISPWRP